MTQSANESVCSECLMPVRENALFCYNCGQKIEKSGEVSVSDVWFKEDFGAENPPEVGMPTVQEVPEKPILSETNQVQSVLAKPIQKPDANKAKEPLVRKPTIDVSIPAPPNKNSEAEKLRIQDRIRNAKIKPREFLRDAKTSAKDPRAKLTPGVTTRKKLVEVIWQDSDRGANRGFVLMSLIISLMGFVLILAAIFIK